VDPVGGSFLIERITASLIERARSYIGEIEALGGMTKALTTGIPKTRIEEAAARTQGKIDSGHQTIVGVNAFQRQSEDALQVLRIDNAKVRDAQLQRLRKLKDERNSQATSLALYRLKEAAKQCSAGLAEPQRPNLLALAIEAARARATVGEMSAALEEVFGRHQATPNAVTGVYKKEMSGNPEEMLALSNLIKKFLDDQGRRPRILVAKMGQDGHDRGQKVIASAFADLGFDVDVGPLFQTPEETAKQAVENDVHVVGISSLAAGHLTLVPALRKALTEAGRPDIGVVVGGVVPPQDYPELMAAGALAIFGPGTVITSAATALLNALMARATDTKNHD
jgi:methylmalonyl-CoA mutase